MGRSIANDEPATLWKIYEEWGIPDQCPGWNPDLKPDEPQSPSLSSSSQWDDDDPQYFDDQCDMDLAMDFERDLNHVLSHTSVDERMPSFPATIVTSSLAMIQATFDPYYTPGNQYHHPGSGSVLSGSDSGHGTRSQYSDFSYRSWIKQEKTTLGSITEAVEDELGFGQLVERPHMNRTALASISNLPFQLLSLKDDIGPNHYVTIPAARKVARTAPYIVAPLNLMRYTPSTTQSEHGRPAVSDRDHGPASNDMDALIPLLAGSEAKAVITELASLRGFAAMKLLDSLQSWLDANPYHERRRTLIRLMIDLASSSRRMPPSLFIKGVCLGSSHPIQFGGCADVFRGTLNGETIALKRLRVHGHGHARTRIHRKFCREGLVWRQLVHPNILPFLGVDAQTFRDIEELAMVSPWMDHGTIMDYVRSSDYEPREYRLQLILEVAQGLEYLHAQGVAHGDLHGSNVLMTKDGHACLTDFGMADFRSMITSRETTVITNSTGTTTTTTREVAGALRWMAPEYVLPDLKVTRRAPSGDVFAFGRLCLAVCTMRQPFHGMRDVMILFLIMGNKHPPRPTESDCGGHSMSDELWRMTNECWVTEPGARPNMSDIARSLCIDCLQ